MFNTFFPQSFYTQKFDVNSYEQDFLAPETPKLDEVFQTTGTSETWFKIYDVCYES